MAEKPEETINHHPKQKQFARFDIVNDYSDHHFRKHPTNPSKKVTKKIMQEWTILQQNLPETITVRVYQNRIDLLRAVIIGAAGTPYHDGLFVFDIIFPWDYPNKPPEVYYHSFGHRINPNLYKDGLVCLSLLNTWSGKGTEKWIPHQSTILQVLVSIQGLILNENPYFNEPYVTPMFGLNANKSKAYNENVFLMSCKSMLSVIKMKPKSFEELVVDHFMNRGNFVLNACKAYKNCEAELGFYNEYAGEADNCSSGRRFKWCNKIVYSKNFKSQMGALYPNLVKGFRSIGASLSDGVEQMGDANDADLNSVPSTWDSSSLHWYVLGLLLFSSILVWFIKCMELSSLSTLRPVAEWSAWGLTGEMH